MTESIKLRLEELENDWPDDLWVFQAGDRINLMRMKNGRRAYLPCGGVDPQYIVQSFDIPSDGGDW